LRGGQVQLLFKITRRTEPVSLPGSAAPGRPKQMETVVIYCRPRQWRPQVWHVNTTAKAFEGQDDSAPARSGAVANGGSKLARRREFPGVVRSRHRRVHWLVLFGTAARIQQNGRAAISVLPRAEAACSFDDQRPTGGREKARIRGRGRWPSQPRTCRGYSTGQGCQTPWQTGRELAHARSGSFTCSPRPRRKSGLSLVRQDVRFY
jgi:hypothetical protein